MDAGKVCATVDVEDFFEGMAVLGHDLGPDSAPAGAGLERLAEHLGSLPGSPKVTLFVVGRWAESLRGALGGFAAAGHEISSHGPDHGRMPSEGLVPWLRRGRDMLEQVLQAPVRGFRSPRFDVPEGGLERYRQALGEAGYEYVSDASVLGEGSAVRELPVLGWRGVRVGGGSYQRLVPSSLVVRAASQWPGPAVLYYHSYDFDGTLPRLGTARSAAVVKQLVARERITRVFFRLVTRLGSVTCADAAR
jgi:peptidoglycan/xylan/chitin deacetylase (PgdA/CDA1 family)